MLAIKELLDSFYHMVVERLYLFHGGGPHAIGIAAQPISWGRSSCSPRLSGTSCRGVSAAWPSSFEFWRVFAQRYLLVLQLIHKAVRAEFWVSSPTSLAATSEARQ